MVHTYQLTQAALGGTALVQSLAAVSSPTRESTKQNIVGAAVCAIAFQHYRWMQSRIDDESAIERIRYMDWFLTLPLLYWECVTTSNVNIPDHPVLFTLSLAFLILMLILGKLSTRFPARRYTLLVGGMLCMVLTLLLFCSMVPSFTHGPTILVLVLMVTWILYGVVALTRVSPSTRSITYNLLDLFNKAIFGLIVVGFTFSQ